MWIREWRRGWVVVAIAVMWVTSCSKEPLVDDRIRDMPRRFVVGGRGYLISEQEAGIVVTLSRQMSEVKSRPSRAQPLIIFADWKSGSTTFLS